MKTLLLRLITSLFLSWALLGCEKKLEPLPPRSYAVEMEEAFTEDVPYNLLGIGQLNASIEVEIKAQVEGYLTNVLFNDGALVEEGELLMTIDPRIYEANLEAAKAQLAENQARLRYALDFAETYGKLVGDEYVSRLEYEQGVQNVDVYKAAIELNLAMIKKAEVDLEFTQLRAPTKGYVGLRKYDPGNVIYPEIDETLVTIRKVTPLMVDFSLPAQHLNEIRRLQREHPLYLEAVLPEDPHHPLQGLLYSIDNKVNKQTGMIKMKGNLPNEDERGWPGAFVRVFLRLKMLKDAVLVPQQAIVLTQEGNIVYVVDKEKMTVSMRPVEKGILYKKYRVIDSGLKPGETVVVDGQLNLYDGAHIFVPERE
ncbi:MAG: efflux RND transporter periplasmic adaptor subunit [Chlamydiales bacterium]|nr:efflux RND transporter periplasmic adaptor subunit [Chlamydiales bacterium]